MITMFNLLTKPGTIAAKTVIYVQTAESPMQEHGAAIKWKWSDLLPLLTFQVWTK